MLFKNKQSNLLAGKLFGEAVLQFGVRFSAKLPERGESLHSMQNFDSSSFLLPQLFFGRAHLCEVRPKGRKRSK